MTYAVDRGRLKVMARGPKKLFENVLRVRVDSLMLSELEEIAKTEDRDLSWVIRKAIENYIQEYKPKKR